MYYVIEENEIGNHTFCFHTFVLKQHIDTVNSVNINKESVGMIEFVRQQMNSNDNSYTG